MTIEHPSRHSGASEAFRPHQGVLLECRDFVCQRVREALAKAVGEIEDELQARRQAASSSDESQKLIELQVLLRSVGAGVDRAFGTGFEEQFQERAKTSNVVGTIYQDENGFFPELALVDDAEIDDTLTVRNLAARLEKSCEAENQDLQTRVAFMLGESDIDNAANPIGPAAICETLKDICWAQDASGERRATILEMLVTRLTGEMSNVYHEVNALLVSRRVMPNVRARAKRGKASQRIAARKRDVAAGEPDASDVVKQLFSSRSSAGEEPDWITRTGANELMQLLNGLQRGQSDVAIGGQSFSLATDTSASGNVISALLEAGLGKHVGSVDGIVIDVVATLFDYIFDDSRVPDPMKGLIGRLQIPVLKLAMMDHSFFSNRAHPARRLINALAQAGVTWDGPLTPDSSLQRSAEAIVLRIQNEFSEDPGVFASCLQEFETYLVEQERYADARAATLTERLKQRERQELARKVAQDALAAHLANEDIPQVVRDFIAGAWLKVLAQAALDSGATSEAPVSSERWREAMATVEELVWSVLPKQGAEARQRMVQRLPVILRTVKAGMATAGLDDAGQKAFFSELVQCHAAALKAGITQADPNSMTTARKTAAVGLKPPADEPTPETLELDLLSRGSWVELKDEFGEIRRVRLTWISPARTMYLFANRQGQRALALTRVELTRRFATGEAVTADQEPLLDRVVDDVLDELRG
ncbi:DUF1631 family protein [Aromatoleum diolicum]|uniref:DUF1631 family protein n=1 Tax=Aromatoleum diolicum TaxID=75796 RepID=A0ABX1QAS5_9RHOO|nr:DUF1631 family protein [Aromatoleum diolicum]